MVLREHAGTQHEHIGHVPALQVLVYHAGLWIGAHRAAAGVVRGLVRNDRIVAGARLGMQRARLHRLGYQRRLVGEKPRHLEFVGMEVEGQPQQRVAIDVVIGGIEIEVGIAIAHHAAVRGDRSALQVILGHRLLPAGTPFRRAFRQLVLQDRPAAGAPQRDVPAADETLRTVIEIVAIELVDGLAQRARAHERVHDLVEEHIHCRRDLVGVVAPNHPGIGFGVVRLADL